jgi:hypothetical protein
MIYPQSVAAQCAQFVRRQIQHRRVISDSQIVSLQSELHRSLIDFYGAGSRLNCSRRDKALIDLAVAITPLALADAQYSARDDIWHLLYSSYVEVLKPFTQSFNKSK